MIPLLNTKTKEITYKLVRKEGMTIYPITANPIIQEQIIAQLNEQNEVKSLPYDPDSSTRPYNLFKKHLMRIDFSNLTLTINTSNKFKKKDKRNLEAMLPKLIQLEQVSEAQN